MNIGTAMLVGLGFLIALLAAALIAPAYRRRTVRLTTDALKRTLPVTESEIRADKDRLRAEHAIRIHNLESKLENVSLSSTRQKIEVNRRDARISELEGIATEQKTKIEELENARRVLEQTVTDRLPRIEGRLNDARKLLLQRDGEIATLAETAQKQARAIAEALQINVQQSAEIDRLNSALSTRAARGQDTAGDARFDGEIALRSEMEALRAKGREQASLIANLQEVIARPRIEPAQNLAVLNAASVKATDTGAAEAEIARLNAELAEAHATVSRLSMATGESEALAGLRAKSERLERTNGELAAEIVRLKESLAAIEASEIDKRSKDSPIAAKAKIAALESQVREQASTIQGLRAETAAVNERLARQAAHYMDEIKRLGGGSLPTAADARRTRAEPTKRSLFDRITEPRVVQLAPRAANEDSVTDPAHEPTARPLFEMSDTAVIAEPVSTTANDTNTEPPTKPTAAPRRPRLLERITSIDKPGSN